MLIDEIIARCVHTQLHRYRGSNKMTHRVSRQRQTRPHAWPWRRRDSRASQPRAIKCPRAEVIAAGPAETVPEAHCKARVILCPLAHDHAVLFMDVIGKVSGRFWIEADDVESGEVVCRYERLSQVRLGGDDGLPEEITLLGEPFGQFRVWHDHLVGGVGPPGLVRTNTDAGSGQRARLLPVQPRYLSH